MRISRLNTFEEHVKFKCLMLVNDEDQLITPDLQKDLEGKLESIFQGKPTQECMLRKISDKLRSKLTPHKDWSSLSLRCQFYTETYNPRQNIKYYSPDFYYRPHFIFFVNVHSDKITSPEKVIQEMLDYADRINTNAFFIINVNMDIAQFVQVSSIGDLLELTLDDDGFQFNELFENRVKEYITDKLIKKISDVQDMNLFEIKKKKKIEGMLECKYLKMYGDFSLLLDSELDAVIYYSTVETIYNICVKKESKWLASAQEGSLASIHLSLSKKSLAEREAYPAEKKQLILARMVSSMSIFLSSWENIEKAGSTLYKYCEFLQFMKMENEFVSLLSKIENTVLNQPIESVVKIKIADIFCNFGYFRKAAHFVSNAFSQIQRAETNQTVNQKHEIEQIELILMIMQTLGIAKTRGYLSDISSNHSDRPLVTKEIVDFLLINLRNLSYIDSRYVKALIVLLKLSSRPQKQDIWKEIIITNPNLDGALIKHDFDLPYFSYVIAKPNLRQIKSLTHKKEGLKGGELFLYDPRAKKVELNWCCNRSEELTIYLYNPLPFPVTISSLEICTNSAQAITHSGKINLSRFERKKKVSVKVKFLTSGKIHITGIKFSFSHLSYIMPIEKDGSCYLVRSYPYLCSYIDPKEVKDQDFESTLVHPTLPDIKASLMHEMDEVLALGEHIKFNVRIQNTSDSDAYISKAAIILEFENAEAQKYVIEDINNTFIKEGENRYISVDLIQGKVKKEEGLVNRISQNRWRIVAHSKKITSRFYHLKIDFEASTDKDSDISSLIVQKFYFKSKDLFKARVEIFDNKILDSEGYWFSERLVYSALITEELFKDMEGFITYRLIDQRNEKVLQEISHVNEGSILLTERIRADIDNYNEQYFNETYRIEWESSILGRRGIVPISYSEFPKSLFKLKWEGFNGEDCNSSVSKKFTLAIEKSEGILDTAFEGKITISGDNLNSVSFIEGITNFELPANESARALDFTAVFLTNGTYEGMVSFKNPKHPQYSYKSPYTITINK